MHHHHTDYDGAIWLCMKMHDELKRKFLDGLGRVPSFGPELDSQVRTFLDGVANWPRANVCWSFEGGRYFGNRGAEYQKTRKVPLYPKVVHYRDQVLHSESAGVMIPLVDELQAHA